MSASATPRLFQLYAAESAAVILSAPDIVVQPDKSGIPGKPMRLAVELYQMLVQIQRFADNVISDALHPHTEDLLLLCVGHILTSSKWQNYAISRYPHGLRPVKNGGSIKTLKMMFFACFLREKSPFSTVFINEIAQCRFERRRCSQPSEISHRIKIFRCRRFRWRLYFFQLSGSQTGGGPSISRFLTREGPTVLCCPHFRDFDPPPEAAPARAPPDRYTPEPV